MNLALQSTERFNIKDYKKQNISMHKDTVDNAYCMDYIYA